MKSKQDAHFEPKRESSDIDRQIRQKTDSKLAVLAKHPEDISKRLADIDKEKSIEQILETKVTTVILIATVGLFFSPWWGILIAIEAVILIQYAIFRRSPLLTLFRYRGYRTKEEILRERTALRILRGDFNQASHIGQMDVIRRVDAVLDMVNQ